MWRTMQWKMIAVMTLVTHAGCNGVEEDSPDAAESDAQSDSDSGSGVCTLGQDQTCNEVASMSALAGQCRDDGTCLCNEGYIVVPASGRCGPGAPASCPDALPVACGDRLAHDTTVHGRTDEWPAYNCSARLEDGRESIYAVTADAAGPCTLMARLTDLTSDLDLFQLESCDSFACAHASPTPLDIQRAEMIAFAVDSGEQEFVVVDGYDGSSGSYTLELDCLCGESAGDFTGGDWLWRVDREWDPSSGTPTQPGDELPDADYQSLVAVIPYDVQVSPDWLTVVVTAEDGVSFDGAVTPTTDGRLVYDLSDATFAGGRFIIWSSAAGLQAELTLFGSGVPIVESRRGGLIRP